MFCFYNYKKYLPNPPVKKLSKPAVKRKSFVDVHEHIVCRFEDFDVFCDFCYAVKNLHKLNDDNLIKNASLYFWNESYYLILKNIDKKSENSFLLFSVLSEFSKIISFSNNFETKLLEYGQTIIKKNAIKTGIKFFAN